MPVNSPRAAHAGSRVFAPASRSHPAGRVHGFQQPPDRRSRRHRATQPGLVGQRAERRLSFPCVGDDHCHIRHHPAWIVPRPTPAKPIQASETAAHNPTRPANSGSNYVPACDNTPVPSTVMTGYLSLGLACTCGSLPARRSWTVSKLRIPSRQALPHFYSPRCVTRSPATATPELGWALCCVLK